MRRSLLLVLAIVAGVLTLATITVLAYRVYEQNRLAVGSVPFGLLSSSQPQDDQAAADAIMTLTLPDLTGRSQAVAQWRGRILVVNFWASWCAPCVEEMPAFSQLQDRYAGSGIQFVGIGMDEADNLRAFANSRPVAYPLLVASPTISDTPGLRILGLPYTLVIDRDGRFAASHLGRLDEGKLEAILRRLSGQ